MAKKAKRKVHQMPPLSSIDRLIYWTLGLLMLAVLVLLLLFPFWYWYRNTFRDETVLAAAMTGNIFWSVLSWCVLLGATVGFWSQTYQKRLPIFGKRDFKYGPPAWPKVYPLFMKNKPYVWVSKQAVEKRRRTAILLAILVILGTLPYPLSFYKRHCLHHDGSMSSYNSFNIQTRDFSSGEIQRVEFEAYIHRRSRKSLVRLADVQVILVTDSGRRYVFDHDEFRGCGWNGSNDWLPAMLELKGRYRPEIITCTGTSYLEKVILDNQLNPQQQAMLYELFEP